MFFFNRTACSILLDLTFKKSVKVCTVFKFFLLLGERQEKMPIQKCMNVCFDVYFLLDVYPSNDVRIFFHS